MTFVKKVISGGQTGADQGGLMAAYDRRIPTGGWCPAEFRTNLGPNPLLEVMGLEPTASLGYVERTCLNVENSDMTLIFGYDLTSPGSKLTRTYAHELNKPYFLFEFPIGHNSLTKEIQLLEQAVALIMVIQPAVINVAGNRDTEAKVSNFVQTRKVFGLILDLINERLAETS